MLILRPVNRDRITAICLSSDGVGAAVYATGPKVGADYQVSSVDVTDFSKSPAVGIITAKISSTRAVVQTGGIVPGYSGLTPGMLYFSGSDAQPTLTPPTPGVSAIAVVQALGVAIDATSIRFNPLLPVVRQG